MAGVGPRINEICPICVGSAICRIDYNTDTFWCEGRYDGVLKRVEHSMIDFDRAQMQKCVATADPLKESDEDLLARIVYVAGEQKIRPGVNLDDLAARYGLKRRTTLTEKTQPIRTHIGVDPGIPPGYVFIQTGGTKTWRAP